MTHIWTTFKTVYQQVGHRRTGTPEQLIAWLAGACAAPLVTADKTALPLWAPCAFRDDRRRLHPMKPGEGGYVEGVYALALDYDDAYAEAVRDAWAGYAGLVHTTYSLGATEKGGRPCAARQVCRLVLPLARPVSADEYAALWSWADQTGRLEGLEADPDARDPSRGWFPPAEHPARRGTLRCYRLEGSQLLDPGPIVAPPAPLPAPVTPEDLAFHEPTAAPPELGAPRAGHRSPPGALEAALARARELPPSVSGQGGDAALYTAACELRRGYLLTEEDTMAALRVYNARAVPPWAETRLRHKTREAMRATHPLWGAHLLRLAAQAPPGNSADPREAAGATEVARQGAGRRGEVRFVDLVATVKALRPGLHHDAFRGGAHDGPDLVDDAYASELRAELSRRGVEVTATATLEALEQAAFERRRNSLQEHLRGLPAGDVAFLEGAAQRYLGVDPKTQPLAETLLRKWLISAMARAFRPGCQADGVLLLQGRKGAGKSTFFKVLAGDMSRYLSLDDIGTKDVYVALDGRWIVEIEEFDKLKGKRDAAEFKAFSSLQTHVFRRPYGRKSVTRPVICVYGATCNPVEFLADPTGNRRVWPIVTHGVDTPALARDRDALLAAALAALEAGEEWHLTREESDRLDELCVPHTEHDEWADLVRDALGSGQVRTRNGRVKLADVARVVLRLEGRDLDPQTQRRLGTVLRGLGWERKQGAHGSEWAPPGAPALRAVEGGA